MCFPWIWTIARHRSFRFRRLLLRQAVQISCQVCLQTFHKPSIVLGILEERPLFNRQKKQKSMGEASGDLTGLYSNFISYLAVESLR
ncbi:hypothetical protein C0J52_21265 [Blattella germanica]|nr:hypothetical protein C0J52_21265 [Blattella germanica]